MIEPLRAAAAGISRGDGSCRRIYRGNGALCHRGRRRGGAARRADRAERLCQASAGRRDLPLPPHDEGMCGAHLPDAGRGDAAALPGALRRMVRGATGSIFTPWRPTGAAGTTTRCCAWCRRMRASCSRRCPRRRCRPLSTNVPPMLLKAHPFALLVLMRSMFNWRNIPKMLELQGAPARRTGGASRAARGGARQPAGRMRPYHELPLL